MGTALDRRDQRYQFRIVAVLLGRTRDTPLLTGDVSYRGVFLRTDTPPAKQQLVRMRLSLPADLGPTGTELVVAGMVANVIEPNDPEGRAPGAGVEFYGMDGELRERWERFVRFIAQHHPGSAAEPVTVAPPGVVDAVQRRHARHAAELPVLLESGRGEPVSPDGGDEAPVTQDISKGGMFIRTTLPLSVGGGVLVKLVVVASQATFAVECVVRRRVFGSQAGVGVEFLEMTDERWRALKEFVRPFASLDDVGAEPTEGAKTRPPALQV
jgi:Tfp pilus assembly protein PilZ